MVRRGSSPPSPESSSVGGLLYDFNTSSLGRASKPSQMSTPPSHRTSTTTVSSRNVPSHLFKRTVHQSESDPDGGRWVTSRMVSSQQTAGPSRNTAAATAAAVANRGSASSASPPPTTNNVPSNLRLSTSSKFSQKGKRRKFSRLVYKT